MNVATNHYWNYLTALHNDYLNAHQLIQAVQQQMQSHLLVRYPILFVRGYLCQVDFAHAKNLNEKKIYDHSGKICELRRFLRTTLNLGYTHDLPWKIFLFFNRSF